MPGLQKIQRLLGVSHRAQKPLCCFRPQPKLSPGPEPGVRPNDWIRNDAEYLWVIVDFKECSYKRVLWYNIIPSLKNIEHHPIDFGNHHRSTVAPAAFSGKGTGARSACGGHRNDLSSLVAGPLTWWLVEITAETTLPPILRCESPIQTVSRSAHFESGLESVGNFADRENSGLLWTPRSRTRIVRHHSEEKHISTWTLLEAGVHRCSKGVAMFEISCQNRRAPWALWHCSPWRCGFPDNGQGWVYCWAQTIEIMLESKSLP